MGKPYDPASVVIKQVEEVAVYLNENGNVVVSQEDSMQQEFQAIIIPVERADDVAAAIKKLANLR